MRRALTVLVGAVMALLPLGVAHAQPADPQVVVVTADKETCGTVTFTLTNNDVGEYGFTFSTGPFNGGPIGEQGLIVAPKGETATRTVRLPEDSFDGQGFVTLGVAYGPNTHRQPFLDLGLVDTDCLPPVTTTTPTTPPVTTPPVTTTPAPTLPPADINCDDVTDAEAQRILDADPSDPNRLDGDNDGDACDDEDSNFSDVGRAPRGGVATGG